jgi:NADH-quinone oxidoreductase subunit N
LAGFPPFSGFFLKYFLFLHIYKSGFFVLAVAGILSGYIMSIIYLQLLIELSILKTIP